MPETNEKIFENHEFYEVNFRNLKLENNEFHNKIFENCYFSESKFTNCQFIDCEFKSCNLSNTRFKNTSFVEIIFDECKLIGVNWTQAKWPIIKLNSPVQFYKCNISDSSFYELDLKEIVIEACVAHRVDFREDDFSNGNFTLTDFDGSLFLHTKLVSVDFTECINYGVDPNQNDIRKSIFSTPDVLNLLNSFDITIQ